jgi:lipoate-protein ligase A
METWRYIEEDGVEAAVGLAADEFLLGQAAATGRTTLRLYTYKPLAALVGRFQNVEAEVRLDECQAIGAAVNRRLTGGGAIVMGDGQLGLAVVLPPAPGGARRSPALLFEQYGRPIIDGLRTLGVAAVFRPKNDIEVAGRKIAGLGFCAEEDGSLLFHASLLVDLDLPLMLRLLTIGPEKISDKDIQAYEDRLTTVCRETGRHVSTGEARQAIRSAFVALPGVDLEDAPFAATECDAIEAIAGGRYRDPAWVFQRMPPADTTGTCTVKTEAGLLRVYVALAGRVIKSVLITGDFFGGLRAIRDVEAKLKWTAPSREAVAAAVEGAWKAAAEGPIWALPPAVLVDAIVSAVDAALSRAREGA